MANRDRLQINNFLGRMGLATLDNPGGMVQQLGFLIRDHDHFRQLLVKCEPEHRYAMYHSLKPHLRFEAKPLDVYIAEAAMDAEARQLPVVDPDGKLQPFKVQEINLDAVKEAAVDALAKYQLTVVCRKCTKAATFSGIKKADAVQSAREAGWVYYEVEGQSREICPDCPGTREPVNTIGSRAEFELVTEFKMVPISVIARYFNPRPDWTRADWDRESLEAARRWAADGKPGGDKPTTVN